MRLLALLLFLVLPGVHAQLFAQRQLTIAECHDKARQNYPAIRQKELVARSGEFNVANARSGYLPQVALFGQATYQSDVTRVPIEMPGFTIATLPKDQYKIYAEVTQSLYDGGLIKRQSALHETATLVEDQKVEVELYKITERINQLYFGALLIDEQLKQADIVKKDIQSALQKAEAAIANGIAYRTSADILQAELLKTDQRVIELLASRGAYLAMLGMFVNEDLPSGTVLLVPDAPSALPTDISRPELQLFTYQSQLLSAQQQLNNTKVTPRAGLFLQAGYGRPGMNMLDPEFATYYIGGLRLSWNLSGFYNSKRDREQLQLNIQSIDVQRNTFLFNTNLSLRQHNSDISKLGELIATDEKIIALRERIKTATKAQLDNGVVTANDFLREVNAEDQARQNLSLHKIQLLMTQFNYQSTSGTPVTK